MNIQEGGMKRRTAGGASPAERADYDNFRRDRYSRSIVSGGDSSIFPFRLSLMDFKLIEVRKDCLFPSHRHSFYELFIPERGGYGCEVNGVHHDVAPDEIVFIQVGDSHADHYLPSSRFLIISFDIRDLEGRPWPHTVFSTGAPSAARLFRLKDSVRLKLIVEALRAAPPKQEDIPVLVPLCRSLFWALLSLVSDRNLSPEFKGARGGGLLHSKALELFSKTPARDFDAAKLAAGLGMSRRSMELRFKAALGLSPAHLFMASKIEEASMLLSSGFSVKEASEELGFANPFHFSRVFKRLKGRPPSSDA
jgi:AraC-like DNA-binding protein